MRRALLRRVGRRPVWRGRRSGCGYGRGYWGAARRSSAQKDPLREGVVILHACDHVLTGGRDPFSMGLCRADGLQRRLHRLAGARQCGQMDMAGALRRWHAVPSRSRQPARPRQPHRTLTEHRSRQNAPALAPPCARCSTRRAHPCSSSPTALPWSTLRTRFCAGGYQMRARRAFPGADDVALCGGDVRRHGAGGVTR